MTHWYDSQENLALLAFALAREFYSGHQIADAIAKPWKWTKEFEYAQVNRGDLSGFEEQTASELARETYADRGNLMTVAEPSKVTPEEHEAHMKASVMAESEAFDSAAGAVNERVLSI